MKRKFYLFTSFLIILFCFTLCKSNKSKSNIPFHTWETATPEQVRLNPVLIDSLNKMLDASDHKINSILVLKDGKLIVEKYFEGIHLDISNISLDFHHRSFDRESLQFAASVTKSINSILVGIAIDKNYIKSADEHVVNYFPEYDSIFSQETKLIKIRDLLTMASGIPWTEDFPYDDPRNDLSQMWASEDPIGFVFTKPITTKIGEEFLYNSGASNILGEIVRKTSGLTLDAFAEKHLFEPLNIQDYTFVGFEKNENIKMASSGLYLRAVDFAKIGELMRRSGKWNGRQIVSKKWVKESTQKKLEVPQNRNPIPEFIHGYSYQWWNGSFKEIPIESYLAAGYGGQFIFVVPDYKMTIVINAGDYENQDYKRIYKMINKYIIKAVVEY
jgi:CubicO group peptidase (beta-lactamase class C family)